MIYMFDYMTWNLFEWVSFAPDFFTNTVNVCRCSAGSVQPPYINTLICHHFLWIYCSLLWHQTWPPLVRPHPSAVSSAVHLKIAAAESNDIIQSHNRAYVPRQRVSRERTRTPASLVRRHLDRRPAPSAPASVSAVSVLQCAADPVLKLEPSGSNPSHSSSIIMGLGCNPVTSRTWSGLRGQRPHSQTLSLYYKSQRGFMWSGCMLTSLCFLCWGRLLPVTVTERQKLRILNIRNINSQTNWWWSNWSSLTVCGQVNITPESVLNTSLQNLWLWPGAGTRPLFWDGLLPDLGRWLLGFARIESQGH